MSITLHLNSTLEARLLAKAAQQGKNVEAIASELLMNALPPVSAETAAVQVRNRIKEFGNCRPFADFKADQIKKYRLP